MTNKSKYKFRYLMSEEYSSWNIFIDSCENATLFHRTFHLETLAKLRGLEFKILGVFNTDNQLTAGFAFTYTTKLGIKNIVIPPITTYYSPVIKNPGKKYISKAESYKHALTNELITELTKNYQILDFIFPQSERDIRPYKWMGFTTDILYSYRITINKDIDPSELYDPDIKRRIKKAQELSFTIREGSDTEFINSYYELQLNSYRRQKTSFVLNETEFKGYFANPDVQQHCKIYLINLEGKDVSGIVILYDKNSAYYFLAGSDSEYLSTGLNQVLFDHVFRDLINKGFGEFDLIGANTPTIARYKGTYNFPIVSYYHVSKIVGRKANFLMKLKSIYGGK